MAPNWLLGGHHVNNLLFVLTLALWLFSSATGTWDFGFEWKVVLQRLLPAGNFRVAFTILSYRIELKRKNVRLAIIIQALCDTYIR